MDVHTRRAALGAIGSIAAAGLALTQRADAAPTASRAEWDKAWREYQRATAAYKSDCKVSDPVMAAHRANAPDEDMINWREFTMVDRNHVLFRLDLDEYRQRVIKGRHVWWFGDDAALARRMAAIDSVQRYRDARAANDRRHDIDAVCARSERLCEAMCAAEDRLMMQIPAPDHAALLWKLEKLLEVDPDRSTPPWAGFYVTQTIADMRRILGGEA